MKIVRSLWATMVGVLIGFHAAAEYPEKPIRLLVPFPPGGASDTVARIMAPQLSQALGQNVIVENKPGADGQIAATEVMRAAPDGYTLIAANAGTMNYVPAVRRTPPYDPTRDFSPISLFTINGFALFVNPAVPATSLPGLIAHARANPGKLSYGSATPGAILLMSGLIANTQTNMVHIPYKGDAAALPDLLTGRIQLMFATPTVYLPHAAEGKLRILATSLPQRSPQFPDVPTLVEAGVTPPAFKSWQGIFGPASMPKALVERLSREINAVLARTDIRIQFEKAGFSASGSSPDELGLVVSEQLEVWRRAVREGQLSQD